MFTWDISPDGPAEPIKKSKTTVDVEELADLVMPLIEVDIPALVEVVYPEVKKRLDAEAGEIDPKDLVKLVSEAIEEM